MLRGAKEQEAYYRDAAAQFGHALERLARGYEADPDRVKDLLQDIHVALWRSFSVFDQRCSLRTWVYRVAHNIAATHLTRDKKLRRQSWVTLDESLLANEPDALVVVAEKQSLERLKNLIQRLEPRDRQVILLYLEGEDAAGIAAVTGLKSGHVTTKVHRIKAVLGRQFHMDTQI